MGKYLESWAKSHTAKQMPSLEKMCPDLPKNIDCCSGRSSLTLARVSEPGGRAQKGTRQRSRVWGFSEGCFVLVFLFERKILMCSMEYD